MRIIYVTAGDECKIYTLRAPLQVSPWTLAAALLITVLLLSLYIKSNTQRTYECPIRSTVKACKYTIDKKTVHSHAIVPLLY